MEQRSHRYAYLLWEFWKLDSEIFPLDILQEASIESKSHAIVLVFDGSQDKIATPGKEVNFYREIIQNMLKKKYPHPQIVLTRVDLIEQKIR